VTIGKWLGTAAAGVVLFAAATGVFVAALWAVSEFVTDHDLRTVAAFVFALVFLLAVISGIVAAFSALRLTDPRRALALPEGSIRAIIALVLVLIFVVMAIYLVETVFVDDTNEDARNVATQLLATVGTLVAAVAAFYFGSAAVTTGTAAATTAVTASRARAPGAVTKGSKRIGDDYELHGFINPHGRQATYYFEYGETRAYGTTTAPSSAGAGSTEQFVSSDRLSQPQPRWHFRIVAHSDAGTTYGNDATIDPLTDEREREKPERERDRGERDRGEKERGEKERGEKERGERERGERERGEREQEKPERERERGEKERGEKEQEKAQQEKPEGGTRRRRTSAERKPKADQEEE
jgi:hypothetical protein